jgi:hypothetical protein
MPASAEIPGIGSKTCPSLNFKEKKIVIAGT